MMYTEIQFEGLQSCSGADFEQFYSLYTEAIAARERKPEAWIREMCGSADYKILLLKHAGQVAAGEVPGKVIGFSVLFVPAPEKFGLLEYMAIAGEHRNAGLGSELFRQSVELARQAWQQQPNSLLLEVDSDR